MVDRIPEVQHYKTCEEKGRRVPPVHLVGRIGALLTFSLISVTAFRARSTIYFTTSTNKIMLDTK